MKPNVLGMELEQARGVLGSLNQDYIVLRTSSRSGISNADSCRVIRQRIVFAGGKEMIELVVSDFKTMLSTDR
ncbi:MAG: hypothetical protein ACYCX2_08675 [Christensenellales bacterium]